MKTKKTKPVIKLGPRERIVTVYFGGPPSFYYTVIIKCEDTGRVREEYIVGSAMTETLRSIKEIAANAHALLVSEVERLTK